MTDSLIGPLIEAGHEVVRVKLESEASYPFPWTIVEFFGLFPEVVLMRAPAARPLDLPSGAFDLVVASGSIWYLRPCMPWQSFLAGPQAEWLRGKRVLTLTTCRNMWITGWKIWVDRLRAQGAEVVDRITVTHSGHAFASFYSTVLWSITGERESRVLPKVEIDAETLSQVKHFGRLLAERLPGEGSLLGDVKTAPVTHAHAFGELTIGARLFPIQARLYFMLSSPGSWLRTVFAVNQLVFTVGLVTTLAVPFLLFHRVFRSRINPWVEGQAELARRTAEP